MKQHEEEIDSSPAFRFVEGAPADVRAAVIMRRNVLQNIAREDVEELVAGDPSRGTPIDVHFDRAIAAPANLRVIATPSFDRAVNDLALAAVDRDDAWRIYFEAFEAKWASRTGITAPTLTPRPMTPWDVKRARVREHLVELVARAWVSGAMEESRLRRINVSDISHVLGREAHRELALDSAPLIVEGALDEIMQVMA